MVRYPSGLRDLSAKQVFVGSNPTLTSKIYTSIVKLVLWCNGLARNATDVEV